jgi:hypothetical protein
MTSGRDGAHDTAAPIASTARVVHSASAAITLHRWRRTGLFGSAQRARSYRIATTVT